MDEILKKFGLKYEDLNSIERDHLLNQIESLKTESLTLDKLKEHLEAMRESVLLEISTYDTNSKQDLFCKARIRNYTLLIQFLSGPEKAKKAMERALQNIGK